MTALLNRREFLGTSTLAGGMLLAGGVAFYGNHVANVRDLSQLLGVKVVMEG